MNGKLRQRIASLEKQVERLARAAELGPTADHIDKVHNEVKAAREDMAGVAAATQEALKGVTSTLAGVLAKTAEVVAAPVTRKTVAPLAPVPDPAPAPPKKANGKTGPTSPATPEPGKENT